MSVLPPAPDNQSLHTLSNDALINRTVLSRTASPIVPPDPATPVNPAVPSPETVPEQTVVTVEQPTAVVEDSADVTVEARELDRTMRDERARRLRLAEERRQEQEDIRELAIRQEENRMAAQQDADNLAQRDRAVRRDDADRQSGMAMQTNLVAQSGVPSSPVPVDANNQVASREETASPLDDTRPVQEPEVSQPITPAASQDYLSVEPVPLRDLALAGYASSEQARPDANNAAAFLATTNAPSVRELSESFAEYDNSRAVVRFDHYMSLFTRYSNTIDEFRIASNQRPNMRQIENAYYRSAGISHYGAVTSELREQFANAIDRWLAGAGVFYPEMLNYSTGDGFRFSPVSPQAQQALSFRDIISTYNRGQIAAYLREMSRLRPDDFLFYDPTGLEALSLADRQEFLNLTEQVLRDAEIDARAADLQYRISQNGMPDFTYLDDQIPANSVRVSDWLNQHRDNYRQLLNSYQRIGLSLISAAFA